MAKRLTIAVPESLFTRLQTVKQHLNISAICQEALKMAIAIQELKRETANRQDLIARLQLEKQAMLHQARQEGLQLGIKSAAYLSYADFQRLEKQYQLGFTLDEEALEDLWQYLDSHDYPENLRISEPGLTHLLLLSPENKGEFVQGWLEGVISVWNDVKKQLDFNSCK